MIIKSLTQQLFSNGATENIKLRFIYFIIKIEPGSTIKVQMIIVRKKAKDIDYDDIFKA